jgi:hypothetical protein
MRQGPRDAIKRARERSVERKRGLSRSGSKPSPEAQGNEPVEAGDDTSDDRVVARESKPRTRELADLVDREIQRDPVPDAPAPERTRSVTRTIRQVASPVPAAEMAAGPRRDSDSRFFDIPEIKPDVALPLLRNNFKLPSPKPNGSRSQGRSGSASDESTEMSAYERALQRAREYRAGSSSDGVAMPTEHQHITSFASTGAEPGLLEDDGDDEIVAFHPDPASGLSRFAAPVEYIDEIAEETLDEDFELERTFRPEETEAQSGHRWWRTFGRNRVFNPGPNIVARAERDPEEELKTEAQATPFFDDENEAFNGSQRAGHFEAQSEGPGRFDIDWDDAALAPLLPARANRPDRLNTGRLISPLDFLNDTDDPDGPLEPLDWARSVNTEIDRKSRFDIQRSPQALPDPTSPEGMEVIRERLFGAVHEPGRTAAEPRPIQTHRPMTRAVVPPGSYPEPRRRDVTIESSAALPADDEPDPGSEDSETEYDYESEYNPDWDLRKIVAGKSVPLLDMTIAISPEIPRKCATCRDFRPSENGQRGWCTNDWAFRHKQLVNAEDLPCDSTIGCWWLPADEEWDRDEFLARLNKRTPRTDQLIAELYGTRRTGSG